MMLDFSNFLTPAIFLFLLGICAHFLKSDLAFPEGFVKLTGLFLMLAIGLHGGIAFKDAEFNAAVSSIIVALLLSISLPIIAYFILCSIGNLDKLNASAIAAHYGSVSMGTFTAAVAFLNMRDVQYESYPIIMLAIMESPAIIIGLLLAKISRNKSGAQNNQQKFKSAITEAFTNSSVILLLGGILIGYFSNRQSLEDIMPFYHNLFNGVLSLFLLAMGLETAKRLHDFYKIGLFFCGFAVLMPVLGASIGIILGYYILNFSSGGIMLVAILAASASYIAVPPAMRMAIPEANPSLYLMLSLGITFPFNVLFGIPLYYKCAIFLAAS